MTALFPTTFSTAQELFHWVRSEEGGRLRVREYDDDPTHAVIYYNKKTSNMELPHVQRCRSVVWDTVKNVPVSVSPVRGLRFSQAVDDGLTNFVTEEFIDGVMINMFYDTAKATWRLATRTQLDATGSFYGKRPFADLFWETFAALGLMTSNLVPGVSYSWVLQHPEERIVVAPPYGIARLYLVESSSEIVAPFDRYRPARYPIRTLEEVKEFVVAGGRHDAGQSVQFQGVVLKDTVTGKRYKLRTNTYDEARRLRGTQANLAYIWLERWSEGRYGAYMRLYPEEQCAADAVVNSFKAATQELHALYQQVYRQKTLRLGEAPQKYRKFLWDAHAVNAGAYFPNLRQFMNTQDTARKLWLVNYDTRFPLSSLSSLASLSAPPSPPSPPSALLPFSPPVQSQEEVQIQFPVTA